MFTSTMTDEEIRHEALLDFLEIKTKLQYGLQDFAQTQRHKQAIHSVVQSRTCRTRRHNNWEVRFFVHSRKPNGGMIYGYLIYLPLQKREQVYYLFLKDTKEFILEIVTPHLLQRYKERYIEPNNINLGWMPLAVYFQRYTTDMKKANFTPPNWTAEEIKTKKVWISDQGLIVTEEKGDMRTFITFLDQESLSQYKALVYEEESLLRKFKEIGLYLDKDFDTYINKAEALFNTPNARKIWERHLRRAANRFLPDYEEQIQKGIEHWDTMQKILQDSLDQKKESNKLLREMQQGIVLPPDFFQKMLKAIVEASELPEKPENDF